MRATLFVRSALLAVLVVAWPLAAGAQADTSPRQIQGLIASGQESAALADLNTALQAHPDSGVAWYLEAEAQDASGNEDAARSALVKAEQYAPGLPFAKPNDVAALQAHLNGAGSVPVATPHRGFSPGIIIIGALFLVYFLWRRSVRRRGMMPPPGYQAGYGPGGQPPYGPTGGMPYQSGYGGMGSGIGGSIITGLAAGAGFAAGERIIDDMTGGGNAGGAFGQGPFNNDPNQVPERDDGLNGSPGWDDNNSGGNDGGGFDPNNSW